MAGEAGRPAEPLSGVGAASAPSASVDAAERSRAQLLAALKHAPHEFNFFQVMRRLERLSRDQPRFGTAPRPADESIRLGQQPSMAFAPSELSELRDAQDGGPPRLLVSFFGLLGPNGPLPLHLTEYTLDRKNNAGDPTMSRFFDLFHHRLLLMMYRAWANGQPTVNRDRPASDRFETYVGSLLGIAQPAMRGADDFPDVAKLFYAGRLSAQARNAEGLAAIVGDFFGMPASVESFMGAWLELAPSDQWALWQPPRKGGRLGISTTLGTRVLGRQQKFRVVLGPLDRRQFQRMLPGGDGLVKLVSLVRSYAGDELGWDLRLFLGETTNEPLTLGQSRLGWTTWLGRSAGGYREDLILNPALNEDRAATA